MATTNPKRLIGLVLLVSVIIGVMLTGGCLRSEASAPGTGTQSQIIENITPAQAFTLIENSPGNPSFVVLDVRTPEEFSEERIENAVNLDYYSPTFRGDLENLDQDKVYLIYCRSGRRTSHTLDIMQELEFREVYNMLGGITRWKEEGLPTTT